MVAGGAGGQALQEEIHSFVTRGLPDAASTSKSEEEINWAELDDLAPEWDRVESGIDDLLSLSTTYWEPGLGPRAPRKAAGEEDEDAGGISKPYSWGEEFLIHSLGRGLKLRSWCGVKGEEEGMREGNIALIGRG